MNIDRLAARAVAGEPLSWPQARLVAACPDSDLDRLTRAALAVKARFFGNSFGFCSILSTKGGPCSENCAFCAQSGHHDAGPIPTFSFLDLVRITAAADAAKDAGATRFSLVTSGKALGEDEFRQLVRGVEAVRERGLVADVSPGILTRDQLATLAQAGAGAYHHNLETGPTYFPSICTSHQYEENVRPVRHAVALGLDTCCGGIFGLGESWDDRIELAFTLRELGVTSVPINFLHPIKGTPMQHRPILSAGEALKIIALFRLLLPDRHIRICGGRHTVFSAAEQEDVFTSGASGVMIGDYLTIKGASADTDAALARKLGLNTNENAAHRPPTRGIS